MERPTMLLVDDAEAQLKALTMIFEDKGFEVDPANGASIAYDLLASQPHRHDILVTDRGIGDVDCYELLSLANELGKFAIVFTADDNTPPSYNGAPVVIKPSWRQVLEVYKTRNDSDT